MSDGRNIIYLYDGSFDGLLTAVFDSYYRKEVPVSIEMPDTLQQNLFCNYYKVETDSDKSNRVSKAIEKNPCKKIYFCNAMSQPGETDGYTVQDHINAIEKHSFKHPVDLVVVNQSKLPKEVLDMYALQKSYPICIGNEATDYAIIQSDLLALDSKGRIRHNPMAVKEVVEELIKGV